MITIVTLKIIYYKWPWKYNNNKEGWNNTKISGIWCRGPKWADAVLKMSSIDLLDTGLPQAFSVQEHSNCKAQ